MKLTGKKLILLLLCPSEERGSAPVVPGRTRLMKMVFLFEKEIWPALKRDRSMDESDLPEFFAWKYGPFSTELLNDLEFLVNRDYVGVQRGTHATNEELEEYEYWLDDLGQASASEYVEEVFLLTEKGIAKAMPLWEGLADNQRAMISDFRTSMITAPLTKILEYVYKKYDKEGYTDKSLIRDRYLRS